MVLDVAKVVPAVRVAWMNADCMQGVELSALLNRIKAAINFHLECNNLIFKEVFAIIYQSFDTRHELDSIM